MQKTKIEIDREKRWKYREAVFYTRAPFWKPKKGACIVGENEDLNYFVPIEGGYPLLFDYREFVEATLKEIKNCMFERSQNQSSTTQEGKE